MSFTLAAQVNEVTNDFSRLFSAYDGGAVQTNELVFDIDPSEAVGFGVRAIVNGTQVKRSVNFVDNSYHHVAMTYDSGLVRLYLDGVPLGERRRASPRRRSNSPTICVSVRTTRRPPPPTKPSKAGPTTSWCTAGPCRPVRSRTCIRLAAW